MGQEQIPESLRGVRVDTTRLVMKGKRRAARGADGSVTVALEPLEFFVGGTLASPQTTTEVSGEVALYAAYTNLVFQQVQYNFIREDLVWYDRSTACGSALVLRKGHPTRQSMAKAASCSKCKVNKVFPCIRARPGGGMGLVVPAPVDLRRGGPESLSYWVPYGGD
jgi:hypothetical protein